MKHLLLTLGYLREQQQRLAQSIATIEMLLGSNGHAKGVRQTIQATEAALDAAAAAANSLIFKKKRGPYKKHRPDQARPLPEVKIPAALTTANLPIDEAILAALKAAKKRVTSAELTAYLVGSGFVAPSTAQSVPITRYVGQQAGRMVQQKLGVRKRAGYWELR
jgi:hypothetical protein